MQLHPAPVLERDTDILDSRALVTRGGHCGQPGSKLVPILRPAPLRTLCCDQEMSCFCMLHHNHRPGGENVFFLEANVCVFKCSFWYTSLSDAMARPRCADWGSVSCMSGGGLLLRLNTWSSVTDWDRRSSSTESCQLLWSPWWSPPTPAASSSVATTTAWRPAGTQSSSPTLCSRLGLAILTSMLPSFSQYLEKPLNRNFSLLKSHISPFTHG